MRPQKLVQLGSSFCDEQALYVDMNPAMKRTLDPVYVVAQDRAGPPPAGWPQASVNAPNVFNASNTIWSFNSRQDAVYWCGLVRGAVGGVGVQLIVMGTGANPAMIL